MMKLLSLYLYSTDRQCYERGLIAGRTAKRTCHDSVKANGARMFDEIMIPVPTDKFK